MTPDHWFQLLLTTATTIASSAVTIVGVALTLRHSRRERQEDLRANSLRRDAAAVGVWAQVIGDAKMKLEQWSAAGDVAVETNLTAVLTELTDLDEGRRSPAGTAEYAVAQASIGSVKNYLREGSLGPSQYNALAERLSEYKASALDLQQHFERLLLGQAADWRRGFPPFYY